MTLEEIRRLFLTVYYAGLFKNHSASITLAEAKKQYTDHMDDQQIETVLEEKATGAAEFGNAITNGMVRIR